MIKVNTNAATTQDFKFIDQIINLETQRKIKQVPCSEDYGIMTACFIDGRFVLVSDYELPEGMYERLQKA